MVFRAVILLVLLSEIGGVSIPSLAGCAIEYLTRQEMMNFTTSEELDGDCDARIEAEITKFYDEIQSLIATGVGIDNLENFNFVNQGKCIIDTLRLFNVSSMYLKGIAYQKLNKAHRSEHSLNLKMTSQQIILLYALQVCEPRSFYARHAEKIFSINMRTTNAQAHCLLNHLNEENEDENAYQFGEEMESIGDLDAQKCEEIVRNSIKKYYNVIDRARSFSVFGLNPEEAMKCRANNDKSLIDHMILLTIFPRLRFTSEQVELEKIKFYEIARESARSFFKCVSMYD